MELSGFHISGGEPRQRAEFAEDFVNSFPNVRQMRLEDCSHEVLYAALTPTQRRSPMRFLNILTVVGLSSTGLVRMTRSRCLAGLGIETLFLINTKLGDQSELYALMSNVRLLDYVLSPKGSWAVHSNGISSTTSIRGGEEIEP